MVEKKLLTLACAAGILACGACFLPPLPEHQPPPLPPRLSLQGIQSIQVSVTNASESHHLNPTDLAQSVIQSINEQATETGVSAYDQRYARDAVLEIIVLSESATPSTTSDKKVSFMIGITATLTRQDGAVIWRETDAKYPFSYNLTSDRSADTWQNAFLRTWLTNMLGTRLVHRMFRGR
jgi:hypothetical protein